MKKLLHQKFTAILILIVTTLALNSCDGEFVYVEDLVGQWEMVDNDGYPVTKFEADYYQFYSDRTGTYSYYDRFGRMWTDDFYWDTLYGEELHISFRDPSIGTMMCYYQVDRNHLFLSDHPSFDHYNTYVRTW